jgi:urease accessory protein
MLTITRRLPPQVRHDIEVMLPYEQRQRSRLLIPAGDGEHVALFLERGPALRDNDYLQAEDGRVVRIVAQPERLLEASCETKEALARVAYHLGNRHVALEIGPTWVRLPEDYVLRAMLAGLGASMRSIEAPFEPESGAYAHHAHRQDQPEFQGVIHQFGPDSGAQA